MKSINGSKSNNTFFIIVERHRFLWHRFEPSGAEHFRSESGEQRSQGSRDDQRNVGSSRRRRQSSSRRSDRKPSGNVDGTKADDRRRDSEVTFQTCPIFFNNLGPADVINGDLLQNIMLFDWWNGIKWNEMEWNGMKWNEMEWKFWGSKH